MSVFKKGMTPAGIAFPGLLEKGCCEIIYGSGEFGPKATPLKTELEDVF
jgi:hypothetical protein